MSINDFFLPNQKVLFLGVGVEIFNFIEFLQTQGVDFKLENRFFFADQNLSLEEKLSHLTSKNCFYLGKNYLEKISNFHPDLIIKAPGIWSLEPKLNQFRQLKGEKSIISSQSFFIQKFSSKTLGVTGTKGKTTTCNLLNLFLQVASLKSFYTGNTVGISPYKYLQDMSSENTAMVLELSSFQLQDLGFSQISPKYSIITNLYVDHQDQHSSVPEYWQAKENIFKYQEKNGVIVSTESVLAKSENLRQFKNKFIVTNDHLDWLKSFIQSPLIGEHNWWNLALALILTQIYQTGTRDWDLLQNSILSQKDLINEKLKTFRPPEHRLELIHQIQYKDFTIRFFDDGAATEPEAVIAALEAFSDKKEEVTWLFLTGKDKGVDTSGLVRKIKDMLQRKELLAVEFCGEIGQKIAKELSIPYFYPSRFKEVLSKKIFYLKEFIEKNQNLRGKKTINILLSPAGSSFDEFNNYLERSQFFKEAVLSINLE